MASSVAIALIIALCAGAAVVAARRVVRRWTDGAVLAGLTLAVAWPIWITCDRFLIKVLPTVWWFDPREPFAPYFLLYLPLSVLIAVPCAAGLIALGRRVLSRRRGGAAG